MTDETIVNAAEDIKPQAPNPEDYAGCCDSGCNPCVYDLYWDAVARHEIALAAWQERHPAEIPPNQT